MHPHHELHFPISKLVRDLLYAQSIIVNITAFFTPVVEY